ncbi:MAG: DUF1761 domain-containing protein [Candidatus Saccharimonadia bacterium]
MFAQVSVWGVLLAAASAMIVGTLWYSTSMFGKTWMKGIGITDAEMKKKMNSTMLVLIAASLATAYVLSLFTVYFHSYVGGSWVMAGFDTALLAWFGLGLTAIFAHGAFDPRDIKVLYINAGNRLVTLVIMGLIIGYFLR